MSLLYHISTKLHLLDILNWFFAKIHKITDIKTLSEIILLFKFEEII